MESPMENQIRPKYWNPQFVEEHREIWRWINLLTKAKQETQMQSQVCLWRENKSPTWSDKMMFDAQ
jgi:hypothetical protein